MSHDLSCKHCGKPTPAGVCRCYGASKEFIGHIADALDEPLPCGHDLLNWCDFCETCGECRDEGKSDGGVIATLRARVAEVEREHEHLRKDLIDISQACGVGCPSQEEAVRRIAVYIADHKTPAEREVIEAAVAHCNDGSGLTWPRLYKAVASLEKERKSNG